MPIDNKFFKIDFSDAVPNLMSLYDQGFRRSVSYHFWGYIYADAFRKNELRILYHARTDSIGLIQDQDITVKQAIEAVRQINLKIKPYNQNKDYCSVLIISSNDLR